jgi:hypothetical protein
MRRHALILLALCLLAPAAAQADHRTAGDGSLVVSDASARVITVKGSGLIFGHIDQGTVTVVAYDAANTSAPQISGSPGKIVGQTVVYFGTDLRFLFPNGRYSLRFDGVGIDISAVGKGTVTASGLGTADDGTVAVNGGKPLDLGLLPLTASFNGGKGIGQNSGKGIGQNIAPAPLAKGH